MENRRGSGIFLSVIGVATLIVAIIGATFAYFSATANSSNTAIQVGSTELDLGYDDVTTGLKTEMIPSTHAIAKYAAFDTAWTTGQTVNIITGKDEAGEDIVTPMAGKGQCIDQNGNQICSVYEFYVGNPSETTEMTITGSVTSTTNDFEHLVFALYDETGAEIMGETEFPATSGTETLDIEQVLKPNPNVESRTGVKDFTKLGENGGTLEYDAKKPSTYQPLTLTPTNGTTNVRHYKMLIWIKETGSDQTDADGNKIFAAGITIKTGGSTGGVTGVIAVANGNA